MCLSNLAPSRVTRLNTAVALLGAIALGACTDHSVDLETFLPKPDWVDSVSAPALNSVEDVNELWRSRKRCCTSKHKLKKNQREMYKACYVAIATHAHDQPLVAKCLQLMDSGMESDVRYRINKHYVENFFYMRSPIDKCSNCMPADPLADVARGLAWLEHGSGNTDKAILVIQRVLDERQNEISTYVQMSLYEMIARLYLHSGGYTPEQLTSLRAARDRLQVDSKKPGAFSGNYKRLETAIGNLLES